MRTAALLSVLTVSVCAQSSRNACSLDPGVEKEYRALPSMSDLSLSWEERYGPRRELAKRYLTDWPLQFMLQQPILHGISISREFELALAHYRSLPDHLLGELLEARLLSSLQRRKSRVAIDDVLSQAAESPWSHLAALVWPPTLETKIRLSRLLSSRVPPALPRRRPCVSVSPIRSRSAKAQGPCPCPTKHYRGGKQKRAGRTRSRAAVSNGPGPDKKLRTARIALMNIGMPFAPTPSMCANILITSRHFGAISFPSAMAKY